MDQWQWVTVRLLKKFTMSWETDSLKTRTLFCEVHIVQDQYKVSVITKMISNW